MYRHAWIVALLLAGTSPAAAQSLRLDPHVDLPKSATAPGWTGGADAGSQFDLDKAKVGGLTAAALALFAPQTATDGAQQLEAKDRAIHAVADRNPTRAAFAR